MYEDRGMHRTQAMTVGFKFRKRSCSLVESPSIHPQFGSESSAMRKVKSSAQGIFTTMYVLVIVVDSSVFRLYVVTSTWYSSATAMAMAGVAVFTLSE